jgi:hypothetical protein
VTQIDIVCHYCGGVREHQVHQPCEQTFWLTCTDCGVGGKGDLRDPELDPQFASLVVEAVRETTRNDMEKAPTND